MRRLHWIGALAIVSMMSGCWSQCDEPFSFRCRAKAEQCFDPVPIGCDQAEGGFRPYEENVALLERGIDEGQICSAVQLGMCPDGIHYVYAVQSEEGRSSTVIDATTGECVGGTFDADELDEEESECRFKDYQPWTGPRHLWEECAKAAYEVIEERRDEGCHPLACTQETDYCIVIEE